MTEPVPTHKQPIAFWLGAATLAAWMIAIAAVGRTEPVAPIDGTVLALAYVLLAAATVWGLAWLIEIHWSLGAVGAILSSPVFVWQFREATRRPDARALVPLACLVAAAALFLLARSASSRVRPRRPPTAAIAAGLACLATVALAYVLSPSLRFELVRHETTLGYPAWALLGPSVPAAERRLWEEKGGQEKITRPTPAPHPGDRPATIVFVLIDTLRRDALAAYGGDPALMPGLDAVASESVVFSDVLANAAWTRASVGSMFTGLYQEYHGAANRENGLSQAVETIAERLTNRGYETAAFVTNWGAVGRDTGFDQGFETFVECRAQGTPYLRADGLTRRVLRWLKRRQRLSPANDRPLFLYVHYTDPHMPYLSGGADSNVFHVARAAYDRELRFLDRHLTRLIQGLGERVDPPLFTLVASDHGEEFGEHHQKGHGFTLYQEVVRIPVLLHTPAHGGASCEARLEGRDLHDLVLTLAANPDVDPADWARARDRDVRYTSQYLTTGFPLYRPNYRTVCVRAAESHGLYFIANAFGPTVEVYDRRADPLERHNISRREADRIPELRRTLEQAAPAPWIDPDTAMLSGKSLEQLKALGYIGSGDEN